MATGRAAMKHHMTTPVVLRNVRHECARDARATLFFACSCVRADRCVPRSGGAARRAPHSTVPSISAAHTTHGAASRSSAYCHGRRAVDQQRIRRRILETTKIPQTAFPIKRIKSMTSIQEGRHTTTEQRNELRIQAHPCRHTVHGCTAACRGAPVSSS